jgi:autotransporter translocation and assembly factor TamB
MKRNSVLAGLILLIVAGLASAADVTGKWQGAFAFQDQSVPLTLDLKGASTVTGTVTGMPSGVAEIKDGKLEGDKLTFYIMIEYQGSPVKLVYKGTVAESEIKFAFGTEDGAFGVEFTAKKG